MFSKKAYRHSPTPLKTRSTEGFSGCRRLSSYVPEIESEFPDLLASSAKSTLASTVLLCLNLGQFCGIFNK